MMGRNLTVSCLLIFLGFTTNAQCIQSSDLVCLKCHSAQSFRDVKVGKAGKSIYVDEDVITLSTHKGKSCLDCHTDFKGQPFPHKQIADPVKCAQCHYSGNTVGAPDVSHIDLYADSVHGTALRNRDPDAPLCKTCHGTHNIRNASDPKSTIYRTNVASTCGKCHYNTGFAKRHNIPSVKKYTNSIHARLIEKKKVFTTAAVCTDCHGVHNIQAPSEQGSPVSRLNLPETCGKCHKEELSHYQQSIHGKAVAKGVPNAPVCTNCHGEHQISESSLPESPVYPLHVVATCSKCHEDIRIQSRYGLPANRLSSYISSFHGVANKYGDVTVANCATCHGAHNILPSSDPKSAINKNNLAATCGKCHPGASKNFSKGSIHVIPSLTNDVLIFWVRAFYMLFVAALIGSFCLYIILDLRARWIGRLPWRRGGHRR